MSTVLEVHASTQTTSNAPINGRIRLDSEMSVEIDSGSEFYAPTRAKSLADAQHQPMWLKMLRPILGQNATPTAHEYQQLIADVYRGDPLMDDYVAWMFANSPRTGKQMFDQALHHGLNSVENCPDALRHLFQEIEKTPDWLDRQLLNDAVTFIQGTGESASHVLRDAALMGGYLLSGFNHALIMTGALNKDASKRFAETAKWWMDCTDYKSLERFGAGFKSTVHVRFIHALVRRNLSANPNWHVEQWGLPICQVDMAATNFAFGLIFLSGLRALGKFPTPHEARSVMHLWKYTGWLMGVDERWLTDREREGAVMFYRTVLTQSKPDWSSKALGTALSLEPLQRHYANFSAVRRRWAYHKHLSVSKFFLGEKKMQLLGLPAHTLPWFPLLTVPLNAVGYTAQRILPPLRKRLQRRGRQAQVDFMASFGEKGFTTIQPDKDHPAHV